MGAAGDFCVFEAALFLAAAGDFCAFFGCFSFAGGVAGGGGTGLGGSNKFSMFIALWDWSSADKLVDLTRGVLVDKALGLFILIIVLEIAFNTGVDCVVVDGAVVDGVLVDGSVVDAVIEVDAVVMVVVGVVGELSLVDCSEADTLSVEPSVKELVSLAD